MRLKFKILARIRAALGATALLAGLTNLAQAAEGPVPASVCQKVGSQGTLSVRSDGAIENTSTTQTLTVDCPIAGTGSGFSIGGTTQGLTYVDHSTSSIACTLRSDDDGTTGFQSTSASSVGDSSALGTMTFSSISGSAGGYIHVTCAIPPADASGNRSRIKGLDFGDSWDSGLVERNIYAASRCRKTFATGALSITTDGAIWNSAGANSGGMTVDCPLLTSEGASTVASPTSVYYVDSSPFAVSCTLYSENPSDGDFNSLTRSSTVDDNVFRSFDFSGGVELFANGFAHYVCVIPGTGGSDFSYLVGYGIDQE